MIIYSIVIAVIAVTYIHILSKEEVLEWWFEFGKKYKGKWFYQPVWGCHLCFSGQMALWTYLLNTIFLNKSLFIYKIIPIFALGSFSVFWLIFFICLTILLSFFLGYLYTITFNKLKEENDKN